MTVIDLGEVRGDTAPDPSPRRLPPSGRPYRSLVVLLVALLTLAGAAPASRRSPVAVPGGPGAEPFLAGDRLYVVEPPDPERGGERRLVAYRRVDARPLWRTSLPAAGAVLGIAERDGTVLLTGRSADDTGYETSSVDARTGRPGWRQPGIAVTDGDTLLLQSVGGREETAIRRVEPSSGRALWSAPTPPGGADLHHGPAGVDRVVIARPSGDVEVLDAASGARLVARNVRPGELPTYQRTQVVGDLLLVVRNGGAAVTGYGLDRLEPRWTAALPLVAYVEPCGELLCAFRQTGGMWALDPATGATRWTDPRWQAVLGAAGGRLLVAAAVSGGPEQAVVDGSTGRVVADLRSWEPARRDDPDDRLIAVRRGPDGRLLVAAVDVATGRLRIADALSGAAGDCRVGGEVLVCRRSVGGFGLWGLR